MSTRQEHAFLAGTAKISGRSETTHRSRTPPRYVVVSPILRDEVRPNDVAAVGCQVLREVRAKPEHYVLAEDVLAVDQVADVGFIRRADSDHCIVDLGAAEAMAMVAVADTGIVDAVRPNCGLIVPVIPPLDRNPNQRAQSPSAVLQA